MSHQQNRFDSDNRVDYKEYQQKKELRCMRSEARKQKRNEKWMNI